MNKKEIMRERNMLCCVLDSLHMLHRKLNGKTEKKHAKNPSLNFIKLFRNERTASGKSMKFFTMQIRTEAIMRP